MKKKIDFFLNNSVALYKARKSQKVIYSDYDRTLKFSEQREHHWIHITKRIKVTESNSKITKKKIYRKKKNIHSYESLVTFVVP